MTKEKLAAELNGCGYPFEPKEALKAAAKAAGLVIVFGASDDLIELRGAIDEESDAYHESETLVFNSGICPDWDSFDHDNESECREYFENKPRSRVIEALWDTTVDGLATSWTYKTDIPHSTFHIMEDDDLYCIGIVFGIKDLPA